MVIVERGHKIIDTEYLSDKFGLVEMDITNVEEEPPHETSEYLKKLKINKDKKQVIDNCNNRQ
jgi:hypothetical protein